MSVESLAFAAFLVAAVIGFAVALWPRFRESLAAEDPVVPDVLARLCDGLQERADEPVACELIAALQADPVAVRHERERWAARLVEEGHGAELIALLDQL